MSCLGTLLQCRERGDRVTLGALSSGGQGGQHDPMVPHEMMAERRQLEASRVAAGLGGEYHCLGAEDGFISDTPDLRKALVRVLRQVEADVILTTPPSDYSQDHLTTSTVAAQAALLSAVAPLRTEEAPLRRPPAVFYMDSIAGLDFQPTTYVDITDQFERKCELLRLHESQMLSLPQYEGWDIVTHAQVVGRFRGLQAHVHYAEAFRPALRDGLLRAGGLLP